MAARLPSLAKPSWDKGFVRRSCKSSPRELDVRWDRLSLVTADTERTPNEGFTAGSHSIQDSGTALRNAAAQAREILVREAATRLDVPADRLRTREGNVLAPNEKSSRMASCVGSSLLHVEARPESQLRPTPEFRFLNKPVQRIDIPGKVTGGIAYVQDLRLAGMLHARVVRPPSYGARLVDFPIASIDKLPGVVHVMHNGSFLAVVAQREFQAVTAMRTLAKMARWEEQSTLPQQDRVREFLLGVPTRDETIADSGNAQSLTNTSTTLEASYSRPYIAHASIGPSCAVALFNSDELTIWTHTQGVFPDRQAIAEMLQMTPQQIRCIHMEGSGCYGHNGADDAAADAALIAKALPGRPVRVQWMRQQEHSWEPFGPAMIARVRGSLDASKQIVAWDYGVWSNTHSMRPGPAGSLLAAQHMASPFAPAPPKPIPQPEGGGDRNSIPLYDLPQVRVVHHFIPDMPVRVSALRSLGAHMNVFAIESFMDELAGAAGTDPVDFRLRHLREMRARDVIGAATRDFGWTPHLSLAKGHGRGFAFAQYKNLAAYCAVAMEVSVDRDTGRIRVLRVAAAVDAGEIVNPDGIRNQIEGGILQSLSWTMYERVTFDSTRISSIDWSTYPILRFAAVPESLTVRLIERPGSPFLGCGEAAQGPAAAALANAFASATGKRLRDLPMNMTRVRDLLGV